MMESNSDDDALLEIINKLDAYRDQAAARITRDRAALMRFGQHNSILNEELLQNKAALNWAVKKIDELCGIDNTIPPEEVASAINATAHRLGLLDVDHVI